MTCIDDISFLLEQDPPRTRSAVQGLRFLFEKKGDSRRTLFHLCAFLIDNPETNSPEVQQALAVFREHWDQAARDEQRLMRACIYSSETRKNATQRRQATRARQATASTEAPEPEPAEDTESPYRWCFECDAVYQTPDDLVKAFEAEAEPGHTLPPEKITSCPECLHDFLSEPDEVITPAYRECFECDAVYPTPASLVNTYQAEDPEAVDITPDDITFCPLCMEDFPAEPAEPTEEPTGPQPYALDPGTSAPEPEPAKVPEKPADVPADEDPEAYTETPEYLERIARQAEEAEYRERMERAPSDELPSGLNPDRAAYENTQRATFEQSDDAIIQPNDDTREIERQLNAWNSHHERLATVPIQGAPCIACNLERTPSEYRATTDDPRCTECRQRDRLPLDVIRREVRIAAQAQNPAREILDTLAALDALDVLRELDARHPAARSADTPAMAAA
ncbi:hypothetical protein [Amycolatopsis anabasis]|uniref:hypothetical protein n=1 Tax=Amycolatopsis anabasis TaxID=1840409 RepID=UPI00131C46B7|nr:hypothetical protein [Amycolatopsis anabasis]